jgi:hypothetical protein
MIERWVTLGERLARLSEAALPWWYYNAASGAVMLVTLLWVGVAMSSAWVAAVGVVPAALLAVSCVAIRNCRRDIRAWRESESLWRRG